MDEPGFLEQKTVAIWGMGLMGGSLALALGGKCRQLIGIDRDPDTIEIALKNNIVDTASPNPAEVLPQADVVILATPVCTIIRMLADLPGYHPGHAIVMDIGSTKCDVINAMQGLPERFDPIGGHPMCGNEHASLVFAERGMFTRSPFALVPLERTSAEAREFGLNLVHATGGDPLWMDAETHDRRVAASSHLPFLVANALVNATPLEAASLVGPGFRSSTRVVSKSPAMMLDILKTNRDEILASLARYKDSLGEMQNYMEAGDFDGLKGWLETAVERHKNLVG